MTKEKKIKLVKIVAIIIGIIYVGIIMKYFFFIGGKDFSIAFGIEKNWPNSVKVEDTSIVRYMRNSGGGSFDVYEFRALKPGTTTITFIYNNNREEVYEVVVDNDLKAEEKRITNGK